MPHRCRLLLHPLFIACLVLLILNDFYFKYACSNWLTGKLSDFSGLFVAGVFFSIVAGELSGRALALLHAGIGLAFALWKLAPVEIILDQVESSTSVMMPSRVKDPGDLIALPVLLLSLGLVLYHRRSDKAVSILFFRRIAVLAIGTLAAVAMIATSYVDRVKLMPDETFDGSIDDAEFLFEFEQVLVTSGFEINQRILTDSGFVYEVTLGRSLDYAAHKSIWKYVPFGDGTIFVRRVTGSGPWTIAELNFKSINSRTDAAELSHLFKTNVIQPLAEKFE